MTSEHEFLRRAIELALEGVESSCGGPFGAVVVRDGRVIGEGCNRVLVDNDPTAHAEVVAIRAACAAQADFSLAGCVLYSSCEPCPMCLSAALWSRVERVVFASSREDAERAGFDDALFYDELAKPAGDRQLRTECHAIPEATRPFELWATKPERTDY